MVTALTGAVMALAALAQSDTTFPVTQGDRLTMFNQGGSVEVQVWNRAAIRITSEDGRHDLGIERLGQEVRVRRRGPRASRSADYRLSVPPWLPISVAGVTSDVTIRGSTAAIRVNVTSGDVWVRGGRGVVSLQTVDGDVTLEEAEGNIHLQTIEGDVSATGIIGPIRAVSVDGDVLLQHVTSPSVDVNTVDGDITYVGTIQPNGHYRLTTHDGDVTVEAPPSVSATVTVSTFSGEFESDFPFTLKTIPRRRFTFTLGGGAAELILEAFDGTIALRRVP